MNLNPNKYVFGITLGKFLEYLVSIKGIEANLDKTKSLADITKKSKRNIIVEWKNRDTKAIYIKVHG